MFMKVYQYPPRRGNGSYWTLLSDGEEELKKAVPLFATLQPPVIDSNSAYHRQPSTHTVKSKGKFVPVLPRSNVSSNLSFFSAGNNQSSSLRVNSSNHGVFASNEIIVDESRGSSELSMSSDDRLITSGELMFSSKLPHHLRDHNYAKFWNLNDTREEMKVENLKTEVIELASGEIKEESSWIESGVESEKSFGSPSTPKRKRKLPGKMRVKMTSTENRNKYYDVSSSPSFTTPPKDGDDSLHLLDTSFLTPLKNLDSDADVELGAISFSPLYTNLVTPRQKRSPSNLITPNQERGLMKHSCLLEPPSQSFLPSPLTPLKTTLDSGIFSPLQSDCLGNIKFSTPTGLSPLALGDLNTFNSLQPEFYPFKGLDSSDSSCNNTPFRPGSLQGLGLPGLTPPPI